MGIDAIDLAFRLEKQFGVKISQTEAAAVLFDTPRTIHRYLLAKLRGDYHQVPCVEPLFLEVSAAVGRVAGRWRRLIPTDNLNTIFPPATRASQWAALEETLGITLPQLEASAECESPSIPRKYESRISLAYWIVEQHPERVQWLPVPREREGQVAAPHGSEEDVWIGLRKCISDALGVKPESVTPDARMIEDLGMG